MLVDAIIDKLGPTQGLTEKEGVIISWPYVSAQPDKATLDVWVAEYKKKISDQKQISDAQEAARKAAWTGTATGTNNMVFSDNPVISNPTLIGVKSNNEAVTGSVGEFISSTVLQASAVSLTSDNSSDITSITLTPGDWNVWASINLVIGGITTVSKVSGWVHTVSASPPTAPNGGSYVHMANSSLSSSNQPFYVFVGQRRYLVSSDTTIYLTTNCTFALSTVAAFGFIGARRVR